MENKQLNKPDMVSHPPHYQSVAGLEVIDVIKAFTEDLKGIEATDTGNIIKYICRWKHKNGLEDLKKAKWYLEHLIRMVERKENMDVVGRNQRCKYAKIEYNEVVCTACDDDDFCIGYDICETYKPKN